MSRDRFLQIFWNLHLCDPSLNASSPRCTKVQPLLDLLIPAFQCHFIPDQHIAVDESMTGFKGRVSFRQYVRGKPHPFGIKAFVLADSKTGYLHNVRIYFGAETDIVEDPSLLQTTRTVITLAEHLQKKAYHLYCDRFYTSPELSVALREMGVMLTGTVRTNRRGMLLAVKAPGKPKLKKGETKAYRAGETMVLQWQDKRLVTLLSSAHSCNVVEVRTRRGQLKEKPLAVQDYNDHMLGVDKMDQLATYYSFLHKYVKWWRKVLFWLLEVATVNAYIVYSTHVQHSGQRPMAHLQFCRAVIHRLVSHHLLLPSQPRPGHHPDQSLERLRNVAHYSEEGSTRRDCRVCSSGSRRRTTKFYCVTCSDHCHLHPGRCFRLYHTQLHFRHCQ